MRKHLKVALNKRSTKDCCARREHNGGECKHAPREADVGMARSYEEVLAKKKTTVRQEYPIHRAMRNCLSPWRLCTDLWMFWMLRKGVWTWFNWGSVSHSSEEDWLLMSVVLDHGRKAETTPVRSGEGPTQFGDKLIHKTVNLLSQTYGVLELEEPWNTLDSLFWEGNGHLEAMSKWIG